MGSPTRMAVIGPLERGEAYAASILEGKVSPAHAHLDANYETPYEAQSGAMAITADMQWWHAHIAMAFYVGYTAGQEESTRRVRGIAGRVKADVRKPARRKR